MIVFAVDGATDTDQQASAVHNDDSRETRENERRKERQQARERTMDGWAQHLGRAGGLFVLNDDCSHRRTCLRVGHEARLSFA